MFTRKQPEEHNIWISFADLFSGFMVIFIVVSLTLFQRDNQSEQAQYRTLATDFDKELKSSAISNLVSVADSATIRFATDNANNPLFLVNDATPQTHLQKALDVFVPIFYIKLQDFYRESQKKDSKFKISEIRIEGHTDKVGDYLYNLNLSSKRALEVHRYVMGKLETDKRYSKDFLQFVRMNSISCGYSFSRMLDSTGNLTTTNPNNDKSRRVEFRILLSKK